MKRGCGVLCLFSLVIFVACFSAIAVGQAVNATLLGTVTDKSGALIPDAKVTITEIKTNIRHVGTTNASGTYQFPNLPPGVYRVDIEQAGFKKATTPSVDVPINSAVRVDAALEPGQAQETITVTAEAALLQTDRADVGTKLESRQVTDLPLAGPNHNFQNLLNLVPGTVRAHRDHSQFFNSQDTLSTEVNGQSRLFNNLQVEGVDDNERTGLLQVYVPPAEAIQTVDVTTSNYAAEFGRAGGAVTNVQLKSGTNDFHGSAYEFNRVSALAARGYFNRKQNNSPFPRSTYNYYGGTFGGPIIKNKTFFFADILRIDDLRGRFNLFDVPIDAYRNGDFSSAGVNIYDPLTGNPDGTGRVPFTCNGRVNVICPDRISPISQKLLALIPRANLPGTVTSTGGIVQTKQNFQNTTRFLKHNTAFDIKLDHQRRDNDRLAFRYSRAVQNVNEQPVFGVTAGGPGQGGFQGTGIQHQQGGALNHSHAFSGTFLVETRVGINNYRNVARNADFGKKDGDAFGIPGANLDDFTSGIPSIRIAGYTSDPLIGYSASQPWDRGETSIDVVNNWTKIHGNHTFKWGADIRRLRDDLVQAQTFSPRGIFRFGDATVAGTTQRNGDSKTNQQANDFAAFLIDMPNNGTGVAVGRDVSVVSGSWRETQTFFFGQDSWKITPKFTLDAGLRWEIYFPATPSKSGRYSNYDPFQNVLVVAGVGGNPKNLGRQTYYKNFAPRVGLAYRLKETTVVRAGFGISYGPFPNNDYAFNFPVRQNNGFIAPNAFVPAPLPNGQQARMVNGFPPPITAAVPANGLVTPTSTTNYNFIDQHFQQPYVEAWNLAVQQALPSNWVLDMAYVGNVGRRVPVAIDLNAAQAPALNANGTTASNNCFVKPECAAFGRTASTNFLFKRTTSNYNALQVKLDHKWAHGFLLTTAYTWGKSLSYRSDAGSDNGGAVYQVTSGPFANFRRNYMNTSRDRTHTFVQSYIYELPFGKGKPWLQQGIGNWLLGGWQVSGIMTIMSGTPLDFNADGGTLALSGTRQTPIQIAPFRVLGGIDTKPWFDTSAFCAVGKAGCPVTANGVLSNLARYSFRGPNFFNLDAGVFRRFAFTERTGLEVRAQAFSVTNTPQFSNPSADFTSANFGKITGTDGGSRSVELGAKFTF
ncbi:MAG TPA: TonB-dependent receptor [Terriglobales bacterium]